MAAKISAKRAALIASIKVELMAETTSAGGRIHAATLIARVAEKLGCAPAIVDRTIEDMTTEVPAAEANANETDTKETEMAKKKAHTPTAKTKAAKTPEIVDEDPLFNEEDDGPLEDDEDDAHLSGPDKAFKEATGEDPDADDDEDDDGDEIDAAVAAVPLPKSRLLKHTFSKDEIDRFRSQREEKDVAIEALTTELDELKERCSKLKKQIDVLQDEGMTLSRRVRTGHEMRSVSTEDRKELDARDDSETKGQLVMVTYRLDTNEPVAWRELTSLEKQGELFPAAPTPLKTELREAAH